MTENSRAGRAPANSFDGRPIREPGRSHFSRRSDLDKTDTANLVAGHRIFVAASRRRFLNRVTLGKNAGGTPAPQNRLEDITAVRAMSLRAVHAVYPGKTKSALLGLDNDVVPSLESIVVVLIHCDAFN